MKYIYEYKLVKKGAEREDSVELTLIMYEEPGEKLYDQFCEKFGPTKKSVYVVVDSPQGARILPLPRAPFRGR